MNDSDPGEKLLGEALIEALVTKGEINEEELDELLDHILGRRPKPKSHLIVQDGAEVTTGSSDGDDAECNGDIARLIANCDLPGYALNELNGAPLHCERPVGSKVAQVKELLSMASVHELSIMDL